MKFAEAFAAMKEGYRAKLSHWKSGYWEYDPDGDRIMMHCSDGRILEIRETDDLSFTLENIMSDDWILVIVSRRFGFGFGKAIDFLKGGRRVAREGWNGKNQYIQLASNISYTFGEEVINCEHDAIGNQAIAFVGTSGVQMGWLASQADMLAEDWMLVD